MSYPKLPKDFKPLNADDDEEIKRSVNREMKRAEEIVRRLPALEDEERFMTNCCYFFDGDDFNAFCAVSGLTLPKKIIYCPYDCSHYTEKEAKVSFKEDCIYYKEDCIYCTVDPRTSKLATCNEAHGERELIRSCPRDCDSYIPDTENKPMPSKIDKMMAKACETLLVAKESDAAVENLLKKVTDMNGVLKKVVERVDYLGNKVKANDIDIEKLDTKAVEVVDEILDEMNERLGNLENKVNNCFECKHSDYPSDNCFEEIATIDKVKNNAYSIDKKLYVVTAWKKIDEEDEWVDSVYDNMEQANDRIEEIKKGDVLTAGYDEFYLNRSK
jgi:hypothetical protein